MTTDQHPGGVAGRYLDTTYVDHRNARMQWQAKKELYDALSREARVILAELETQYQEHIEGGESYAAMITGDERRYLTRAFTRLGFTLTEPDIGGDGGCGMPYGVFGEGNSDK